MAIGVVLAVLISLGAGALAVSSSDTRAEDVAARVAPEVIRQVIADSRAQRTANARGVLAAANEVLAGRGLPMVADPGRQANAEQVLAAASSAQVLSVLPEDTVARLRSQFNGGPIMLPSATVNPQLGPDDPIDTAAPGPGASGEVGGPAPVPGPGGIPGSPSAPGAGPSPGSPPGAVSPAPSSPAPAPETRRRLIPQILPLPLPLIGT